MTPFGRATAPPLVAPVASFAALAKAAVWYAETLGWYVFCLRPRTKDPYPNPDGILPGEGGYKLATRNPSTVTDHWQRHPRANIGLWPAPSGVIGFDLDGPEQLALAADFPWLLMPTLSATTGRADGGRHAYFAAPNDSGFQIGNKARIGGLIQIRHRCGYLVLPPSVHPVTGNRYTWHPAELLPLPDDGIVAAYAAAEQRGDAPVAISRNNGCPATGERANDPEEPAIPRGQQHDTLAQNLGSYLNQHPLGVARAFYERDIRRCDPPADLRKTDAIWRDLIRAESAKPAADGFAIAGIRPSDRLADPATRRTRHLVLVEATDVVEVPVEWAWRHRIVGGALNLVEGRPEAGKTTIVLDLLARVSSGSPLPDGCPTSEGRVLIVGSEDAVESVVRPRLRVAGAKLENIRFVRGVVSTDADVPGQLKLPRDLQLLADAMADRTWLYIDGSVYDYAERGIRPGDDIAFRDILGGVHELARQGRATALVPRHLKKGIGVDALEAGAGTMGMIAKPRSTLAVYRDPQDPDIRLVCRVKCNLGPTVPTLRCRFTADEDDSPLRVEWLGTDARAADEILTAIRQAAAGSGEDTSVARKSLVEWLRDGLPHPVNQLKAQAAATGLSWKAYERVKRNLGLVTQQVPGSGWTWQDPYCTSRDLY